MWYKSKNNNMNVVKVTCPFARMHGKISDLATSTEKWSVQCFLSQYEHKAWIFIFTPNKGMLIAQVISVSATFVYKSVWRTMEIFYFKM